MRRTLSILVTASVTGLLAGSAVAAAPRLQPTGNPVYPNRSFILALPSPRSIAPGDVRLRENGQPVVGLRVLREGASVQSRTGVVILIDESLTMRGRPIVDAFAAARTFAERAKTDVEVAIITFNGTVKVLQPFTYSATAVANTLKRPVHLAYGTKSYNALQQAGAMISAAHVASGVVIILTDGQNVGSTVKPIPVLKALGADHVRVFTVGLHSPAFNPRALEQMSAITGGSFVAAADVSRLTPILNTIGQRLSSEYLLRYRSLANPATHVTVSVRVAGEAGVARTAYTTPPLKIVPAPPYKPSQFAKLIVSPIVTVIVVVAFVMLILFALANALSEKSAPLLTRVGGFVSVSGDARAESDTTQAAIAPRGQGTRFGLLTRLQESAETKRLTKGLSATLDLADINATPVQIVLLTAAATIVTAFILDLALGPLGILAALIVVPYAARFLILRKLKRKRKAFAEQLPDSLDVLASALRAGHSLVSALAVVAEDASEPSKSEYRRVVTEEQLGAQLEDALKVTAVRMNNRDVEQVALVARLQREMGSNSAEVLDRVIETVRGRMELRRLVRTLTAQGRLSRWILTGLPIGLALILTLLDAHYMHPLFHSFLGRALVIFSAAMVALGSFIIGKIIDIKA